MNTSTNKRLTSSFIHAANMVQKAQSMRRAENRLKNVLPANKVRFVDAPVIIGAPEQPEEPKDPKNTEQQIQLTPILEDTQIRSLKATCSCGCEATFDIQYAPGEEKPHDT